MNPEFREQVNSARRAGYTDPEILEFVANQSPDMAAKIQDAIGQGYSPQDIMGFLAPEPTAGETAKRYVGVAGRAALPYATSAAGGATAGFAMGGPPGAVVGTIAGLLAQGLSDAAITAYNAVVDEKDKIPTTTEGLRILYERLGLGGVKPETRGERMVEAGTEALAGTVPMVRAGQVGSKLPGAAGAVAQEVSRAPLTQMITAPVVGGSTQYVAEATGSPLAAIVTGVGTSAAAGARPRVRGQGPSIEDVKRQYQGLYQKAKDSGVVFDTDKFNQSMSSITADLRSEGYTPTGFPKIADAINELKSNALPKDMVELTALRKIIKAAGSESDEARRLSQIVLNRFDEYLINAPDSHFVSGDKKGIDYLRQARNAFTKEKKAEIFDDMLAKADIKGSTRFTQSGAENVLANELGKLATDKDRLRFFTKDEQAAIKQAAKGGNVQNFLRWAGKVSPTSIIAGSGAVYLGGTLFGPTGAAVVPILGGASRIGAEQMRIGSVERIIDQILSGKKPPSPAINVPTTTARGLLSTETE
jgi:hypothetical protein